MCFLLGRQSLHLFDRGMSWRPTAFGTAGCCRIIWKHLSRSLSLTLSFSRMSDAYKRLAQLPAPPPVSPHLSAHLSRYPSPLGMSISHATLVPSRSVHLLRYPSPSSVYVAGQSGPPCKAMDMCPATLHKDCPTRSEGLPSSQNKPVKAAQDNPALTVLRVS